MVASEIEARDADLLPIWRRIARWRPQRGANERAPPLPRAELRRGGALLLRAERDGRRRRDGGLVLRGVRRDAQRRERLERLERARRRNALRLRILRRALRLRRCRARRARDDGRDELRDECSAENMRGSESNYQQYSQHNVTAKEYKRT